MFGSEEAAATEAAETDNTGNGQSHASPAADAGVVPVVTDDHQQSKQVGDSEGQPENSEPAVKRKKKTKKESKRGDKESAVLVKTQAHVKKQKGKKASSADEKQATKPVSLLGLDSADAPWADEIVPEGIAAQHVTQHPAPTVKKAKQAQMETKGKSQLEGVKIAGGAPSQDQTLALLGYGAAKKQSKKHRIGRAS